MKSLSLILSLIFVSIIVLSACCLVKGVDMHSDHSSPCLGSCLIDSSAIYSGESFDYFNFNKIIFFFAFTLLLFLIYLPLNLVNKLKQNDFKIFSSLDKYIQTGLLHPKIY